jgi:hypothetical protein
VRLEPHVDQPAGGGDDVRAEGQVRDEPAVHHVPLDAVDPGLLQLLDLPSEGGEISGQHRCDQRRMRGDGRGNDHGTSSTDGPRR